MLVIECEVHNIELTGDFVIDALPDDGLLAEVRIVPLDNHAEAVQELRLRHKVWLTVDPETQELVPETNGPPKQELRVFPVTTAFAELHLRALEPEQDAYWRQLQCELTPVRHVLSFVYRRSINFVKMRVGEREAPTYNYQPNLIAGNHQEPLLDEPEQRHEFVGTAIPVYRTASASVDAPAVTDGLLYYLSHTREGLRIEERFLMLFIALEVLSNAHAQETNTENILPEEVFAELEKQMKDCLAFLPDALAEYPEVNVQSTVDMLRTKMGTDMKRNSIRRKIKRLAAAHGLNSYADLVGGWVDARNGFVHEGTIEALAVPVEERVTFWEDCIARLAGFIERVLVADLIAEHPPMSFWFSDCWREGRFRCSELWPPSPD